MNFYLLIIVIYTLGLMFVLTSFVKKIIAYKEREVIYGNTIYQLKSNSKAALLFNIVFLTAFLYYVFMYWLKFNNNLSTVGFEVIINSLNQILTVAGLITGIILQFNCGLAEIGENGLIYNYKIFLWEEICKYEWYKYTYTDKDKWVLIIKAKDKTEIEWDIKEDWKEKIDSFLQSKV